MGGAFLPHRDKRARGFWSDADKLEPINVLELKAVLHGLIALCSEFSAVRRPILIHVDNMTAVTCLRNFGGTHSPKCNEMTLQIWEWAEQNRIWLSSTHIAGIDNLEADSLSRSRETLSKNKFNVSEWGLCPRVFAGLAEWFQEPSFDLFASAHNAKYERFASWKADASACKIDAFPILGSDLNLYAFWAFLPSAQSVEKGGGGRGHRDPDRSVLSHRFLVPASPQPPSLSHFEPVTDVLLLLLSRNLYHQSGQQDELGRLLQLFPAPVAAKDALDSDISQMNSSLSLT